MATTISLSDDIHIFYNKIFQISSTDDYAEEPYLILNFVYNVDGVRVEHGVTGESRQMFAECNPSSLRALIEDKEPIPLNAMIDPQDAEISRESISNILASLVHDCAAVEGLRERRMNSLEKNVYKNVATANEENEVCAICLHEMAVEEEVACTPCVHRFHYICISRWFEKSGLCPLCRFGIDPYSYKDIASPEIPQV